MKIDMVSVPTAPAAAPSSARLYPLRMTRGAAHDAPLEGPTQPFTSRDDVANLGDADLLGPPLNTAESEAL
jgi:hypothetical protein